MPPKYQRKRVKDNPERDIALGMIISTEFNKRIQPILRPDLIDTPFILTVINWCKGFFAEHKEAPGIYIQDIYKEQVELGNLPDEEEELISDFLNTLSSEYEMASSFNASYLLSKAEKFFETRNISRKNNSIRSALALGDIEAAQKEFLDYKRVALPVSAGIDPLTDKESIRLAFESAEEPLFKVPGAAGQFLNDLFVPEGFVTFLGPEKRGKTWWLIELTLWARRAGLNVAFFSAGDMSERQLQLRFSVRLARRSNKQKYCREMLIPCLDCRKNQNDSCDMPERTSDFSIIKDKEKWELLSYEEADGYAPCTFCMQHPIHKRNFQPAAWHSVRKEVNPLTWEEAIKIGEKYDRRWGKRSKIKMTSYPNQSLSVSRIEHCLDLWEQEDGFIPNVIVTDYMDLLVADQFADQFRHSINTIWASSRGLSQKRKLLFISASQSDSATYNQQWIGMGNFSEDKRKISHVTGIVTLNQWKDEKKRGIMRLGKIASREEDFDERNGVTCLYSLAMGSPLLYSY